MGHFDAGHRLEQFGRDMRGAAEPGRAVEQFAGFRLGIGDQLGDRFHRQRIGDRAKVGHPRDDDDRRDILGLIVGHVLEHELVDGVRARRAHHEGVTVGLGLCDVVGRDVAAGAGLVLDDELLAEFLRDLCRDDAGQDVGGAAGREGNDELDRPCRPWLGGARPAAAAATCRRAPAAPVNMARRLTMPRWSPGTSNSSIYSLEKGVGPYSLIAAPAALILRMPQRLRHHGHKSDQARRRRSAIAPWLIIEMPGAARGSATTSGNSAPAGVWATDAGECGHRHHDADRGLVPFLFGQQVDREIGAEAVAHVGEKEIQRIQRPLDVPCPDNGQSLLAWFRPSANFR